MYEKVKILSKLHLHLTTHITKIYSMCDVEINTNSKIKQVEC